MKNLNTKKFGIIGTINFKGAISDSVISYQLPININSASTEFKNIIIGEAERENINPKDINWNNVAVTLILDIYKDSKPQIETSLGIIYNDEYNTFIDVELEENELKDIIYECIIG